jgi:hypothetical protein
VKPEPILPGLEAAGARGQGPQWAVRPVEEELFYITSHNVAQNNHEQRR